jgi:hypothetical protein
MSGVEPVFRIHPAIGFARVGNSDDYLLAPETVPGLPAAEGSETVGGLPIRPGTESGTITSRDLRDGNGALKRQGARFRIFQYAAADAAVYPCGKGTEVRLGSVIGGKRVVDIVWTAHLANKKANAYVFNGDLGAALYEKQNESRLQVRNSSEGDDLGQASRLQRLVIDPGPRAIRGTDDCAVPFDKPTPASFWNGGAQIRALDGYPKSFPDDSFSPLYAPTGVIDTLGELRTDPEGRLIVLGAYGRACARYRDDGKPYPLASGQVSPGVIADLNEDGWFDDSADGPVSAVLVFDDASVQTAHPAWVVVAPPSFAPQCLNVVSLWDDVYDAAIRKLRLRPEIFDGRFQESYEPSFDMDVYPMFRATALQQWNVNLPQRAIEAHEAVGDIKATDRPEDTILSGLAYVRDPNNPNQHADGAPLMPLSIGDVGKSFLTVTPTQYFFLTQWNKGRCRKTNAPRLGPGESLDRIAMANCMGGGFGPGLEMTFVVRDADFFRSDWRATGAGPFRVRARPLDYGEAQSGRPFLTVGYVPLHPSPDGGLPAPLEPGDATKFLSMPWHTDFNACATHNTDPNPRNSTTLYWAWPAQRPSHVRRAQDVENGQLGRWRYSFRGKGTQSDDLGTAGRYQDYIDMLLNWHKVGTVIQGSAIAADSAYSPTQFLEVEGRLDEAAEIEIQPWPMNSDKPGE